MASITTRVGKGSPLTTQELDANFTNLNTDKAEKSTTTEQADIGTAPNDIPLNQYLGALAYRDTVMVPVPASATAQGAVGEIAASASYLYVCVAVNTWVRAAVATW